MNFLLGLDFSIRTLNSSNLLPKESSSSLSVGVLSCSLFMGLLYHWEGNKVGRGGLIDKETEEVIRHQVVELGEVFKDRGFMRGVRWVVLADGGYCWWVIIIWDGDKEPREPA